MDMFGLSRPDAGAVSMVLTLEKKLWQLGQPKSIVVDLLRKARAQYPDDPDLAICLATRARAIADWRDLKIDWARCVAQATEPFSPFSLLWLTDDPALHRMAAARAAARCAELAGAEYPHPPGGVRRKLRIGYLSADLRDHSVSRLAAELFERHDRQRIDVIGYSLSPSDKSAIRQRLAAAFDQFIDLEHCSDAAAAERIHDDKIDIIVDLNGYTRGHRLGILLRRPAPIQVSYLGYPGTLASAAIDYIIGDPIVLPQAAAGHFSECVALLPDCYQPNDAKKPIASPPPTRAAAGLPASGFVFCCFNHHHKITPEIFSVWMRLLGKIDHAMLWLLDGDAAAKANLRREAEARGIAADRLIFGPHLPLADHLARLSLADLALDTLPYGAHTTASDALWAGLPLVTCLGSSFAGRVGASLLSAIGLPDLIATGLDAYEALALRLASNAGELARIRQRLAANRASRPLFDCARIARHLESAYALMWAIHCDGGGPRPFGIVPAPR